MGTALAQMLPYALGLLVAPLPIVAASLLRAGRHGTRKMVIFVVTWMLVSFVAVLVLAVVFGGASIVVHSAFKIALGVILLVVAARRYIALRRRSHRPPDWLGRVESMPPDRLAGLAATLLLTNPITVAMLVAAALTLGAHRLSALEDLLPTLIFAIVGGLALLLPLTGRVSTPRLLRHAGVLTFLLALGFGTVLLIDGLRALP